MPMYMYVDLEQRTFPLENDVEEEPAANIQRANFGTEHMYVCVLITMVL